MDKYCPRPTDQPGSPLFVGPSTSKMGPAPHPLSEIKPNLSPVRPKKAHSGLRPFERGREHSTAQHRKSSGNVEEAKERRQAATAFFSHPKLLVISQDTIFYWAKFSLP